MHFSRIEKTFGCFLTVVIAMMTSSFAHARERHEFFNGARALAMGGAYVATVNDETALASNPAGLGRLRDFYGTIFDPELELGTRLSDMYRADPFSQPFTFDDVASTMQANQGTYYHAAGQIFPSFVARNFGIGLLLRNSLSGEAKSATRADVFQRDDMALLLGFNARLWGGRIKIGVTGKAISRTELNESDLDLTLPTDASSLAGTGKLRSGTGFGADAAILLTAPWTWLPTIGAVVHDVGNTAFTQTAGMRVADATTRPDMAMQDVDAAISLSPIHASGIRSMWTLEYRGLLTSATETDKAKLMHFGTEFNFGDILFLRAGYNQRYWTAGFELASESFQFQLSSYGEEVGDETAPREDRRMVVKIGFRF